MRPVMPVGRALFAGVFLVVANLAMARDDAAPGTRVPSLNELKASAEKANPVAQNNLAVMYATGAGGRQDYQEAARWYQAVGEQGYAVAQYNLAALYELGLGVPQDVAAAKIWYELAARQGDGWAQLALGRLLSPADPTAAYVWLHGATVSEDRDVQALAKEALASLRLTTAERMRAIELIKTDQTPLRRADR